MYAYAGVIIVIILVVVLLSRKKVLVKSNVDGLYYSVLDEQRNQDVADALAEINKRVGLLAEAIQDPIVKQALKSKYSYKIISEAVRAEGMTSYTINKKNIHVCVRSPKDLEKVYDINTLMYVVIHELAHLIAKGIGHEDEFRSLFRHLLKEAVVSGVYTVQDYSATPVEYCGMTLASNILL